MRATLAAALMVAALVASPAQSAGLPDLSGRADPAMLVALGAAVEAERAAVDRLKAATGHEAEVKAITEASAALYRAIERAMEALGQTPPPPPPRKH